MTGDIRKHLEVTPFVPLIVRTSDDREYPVPALDRIYLPPSGGRVVIRTMRAWSWLSRGRN